MLRRPSASIVPRGFPEGRSCGTLGVDGRRCMGAVRHPSLPLCLAQLPPGVLRRTLGRVAVDTANSMTNEGTRAQHTCAVRAYSPLAHSLCDPSSVKIHWVSFLRERRLMDTEGSLGLCGGKAGRRPSPWAAPLAARGALLVSGRF